MAEDHGRWLFSTAASNSHLLFAISALGATNRLTNAQGAEIMIRKGSDYHVTQAHAIWLKLRAIQLLNSTLTQPLSSGLDSVIYSIMCLLLVSVRPVPLNTVAHGRSDEGRLRRMMRPRSEHTQTLYGSFSRITITLRAYQSISLQLWYRELSQCLGQRYRPINTPGLATFLHQPS